jgi:hypothetical protein
VAARLGQELDLVSIEIGEEIVCLRLTYSNMSGGDVVRFVYVVQVRRSGRRICGLRSDRIRCRRRWKGRGWGAISSTVI